ncbi:MAG: HAMP domain-containing sensor histidine kinase [Trueperaceae bacterium]|nr:HAMP domain-containing sensor histidine kinase [Trueperaceae bacterium]
MSLKSGIGVGVALLAAAVIVAFGLLAYGGFVRQQEASTRRLLADDLARVAALLENPVLGASLATGSAPGFVVQLVDADGQMVLAWGSDAPLPLVAPAAQVLVAGRPHLVGSAPWRDAGATIRIAHDLEAALATRRELARSLVLGGALTFVLAILVATVAVGRALSPLDRVAAAARTVDPATPAPIRYDGGLTEIRSLTDALNHSLAAIGQRTRAERAFLLEVAHELAGPLTLVRFHLIEAGDRHPDDPQLRAAAVAAHELLRTSQDLLVLARGELERPVETHVVELRALLDQAAGEYPGVAVLASSAGEVIGDRDRLMQVVRNLVRNGVQAAGRPEGVRLELAADGDVQVVRVVDDGPGLAADAPATVFERGVRGGSGSGVGLAIARQLVEQHGGSIAARSGAGGGAVFEVRLPSLAARLEAPDAGS